jgi:hypothetical protein
LNWVPQLARLETLSYELLSLAHLNSQILPAQEGQELEEARHEAMEQLWRKRRRLAGEINLTSQKLAPCWQNWPQFFTELTPEEQNQFLAGIDSIKKNWETIKKLDKGAKVILEKLLTKTRRELMDINVTNNVLKAYRPAPLVNSRYAIPSQLSRTT